MNGAAQFVRYGAKRGGQVLETRPYGRAASLLAPCAQLVPAPSLIAGLVVVVLVLSVLLGIISQGNGG